MSTYIVLANYTDQGIRNVTDSPSRLEAVKNLLLELGGEMKDFYLTMGGYDIVVVIEAPNDEVAAKFALKTASFGNVRTTTLKAFPEAEYRRIISELP